MTTIKIHDVLQNTEIEREMNEEELSDWQLAKMDSENRIEQKKLKLALLEKLGITEDEAKLLLS